VLTRSDYGAVAGFVGNSHTRGWQVGRVPRTMTGGSSRERELLSDNEVLCAELTEASAGAWLWGLRPFAAMVRVARTLADPSFVGNSRTGV
jgi:hypothetical protein